MQAKFVDIGKVVDRIWEREDEFDAHMHDGAWIEGTAHNVVDMVLTIFLEG